ncbi:hypothetical protein PR048_018979 [Dryococelus australis]|uniref:Uncharacterized protein n=1 Tax=Dryococelus australis TaxID=614101 RepID=A0ABQ9H268_9NEOP|nr:hypothetical protein PR048_018979 [Dryococelus australis]
MMSLVGGFFLGNLPFHPPFHSGAVPYSPCFVLIDSQDLDLVGSVSNDLIVDETLSRTCRPTYQLIDTENDNCRMQVSFRLPPTCSFSLGLRPSDKGYTATRIKSPIAAKSKALNWRAVFSSLCVYLWHFQRRPYYFIGGKYNRLRRGINNTLSTEAAVSRNAFRTVSKTALVREAALTLRVVCRCCLVVLRREREVRARGVGAGDEAQPRRRGNAAVIDPGHVGPPTSPPLPSPPLYVPRLSPPMFDPPSPGPSKVLRTFIPYPPVTLEAPLSRARISAFRNTRFEKTRQAPSDPIGPHTVFDTSWRATVQSWPSTVTADNQRAADIGACVVQSSLTARSNQSNTEVRSQSVAQANIKRVRTHQRNVFRGGVAVRLLASHRGEPGSIPGWVAPGFPHGRIVSCLVGGFSRGSAVSPFPSFRRCSILTSMPLSHNGRRDCTWNKYETQPVRVSRWVGVE